jgi:hypothetical protein
MAKMKMNFTGRSTNMAKSSKEDNFLIAALTEEEIKKLIEVEQFLNRNRGRSRKEAVYLVAYSQQ